MNGNKVAIICTCQSTYFNFKVSRNFRSIDLFNYMVCLILSLSLVISSFKKRMLCSDKSVGTFELRCEAIKSTQFMETGSHGSAYLGPINLSCHHSEIDSS